MNPKVPTTRQFAHDAFFTMAASLQAAAVEIGLCWAWSNGYLPMRDYSYFTLEKKGWGLREDTIFYKYSKKNLL